MINKKTCKKGFSLVEVMISVALFSILSVVLGVILNIGLKSWKDVDGKTEAERGLNRAVLDINDSIRNSKFFDIDSAKIYSGDKDNPDPFGYLVLPSYVKYNDSYILEQEFDFSINLVNSSDESDISFSSEYNNNFMIAYFLVRETNCSYCNSIFGNIGDSNLAKKICPHKVLVKKWFKTPLSSSSCSAVVSTWSSVDDITSKSVNTFLSTRSKTDKVLSRNVMAFAATKIDTSRTIFYKIKVFKPSINKTISISAGGEANKSFDEEMDISMDSFYDNSVQDSLESYCLEVHSTVAPLN